MQKIHLKQNINFLINKHEKVGLKYSEDPKSFTEYSKDIKMFIILLKNIIQEGNAKY